jgi:hypothetical protein
VVGRTGSDQSAAADATCGPACGKKNPTGFCAGTQVFEGMPQRSGGLKQTRQR